MTQKHIEKLAFSSQMQALAERSGDFDVLQILGVSSRELAYSNVMAFFLDPTGTHRFGSKPLVAFLRCLDSATDGDVLPFKSLLGNDVGPVRVRREYKGIDLLIELLEHGTAIAVENKVYAAEQQDQVARYQAILSREYPHWTLGIAFLTPFGAYPETNDNKSNVPVIPVDYAHFAEILESICVDTSSESGSFARAVALNIRHKILGEHPMKDKIYALWADPQFSEALSEVVYHAPNLTTVKEEFTQRVKTWAQRQRGLSVSSEDVYPRRGEPYELALKFMEWDAVGLPVTIKFYWYQDTAHWNDPDHQPGIRAFIWWEDFESHKENFERLKTRNSNNVSQDFSPIKSWTNWRRFFAEDDYPQESLVPFRSDGFIEALVERACDVITEVDDIVRADNGTE